MKSTVGNHVTVVALFFVLALAAGDDVRADDRIVKIVMIGDSITEGKVPELESIPSQLEFALKARGQSVSVTNAGAGGNSAAQGLARLNRVVKNDTDAVIVALGWWDMDRDLIQTSRALPSGQFWRTFKLVGSLCSSAGCERARTLERNMRKHLPRCSLASPASTMFYSSQPSTMRFSAMLN
jgi:lysophospholipase L1-like esterase